MRIPGVAALVLCALAPLRAQSFCDKVRALTVDPTVAAAHWGVAVTTLDGAMLCGVNEGQLFRPASNAKLFTTSAALALLGAKTTYTTRVTGKLDAATGAVQGDLALVGGGDANLDSGDLPYITPADRPKAAPAPFAFHDLEDLAAQLVANGVKSVAGDVVGDDTLFPWEPYPQAWALDDLTWYYGAPVSALTIADSQLRLTVTPGKITGAPGHEAYPPASVALEQNGVAYYTVVAQVQTAKAGARSGVQVERLPGSRVVRVYGTIAEDAKAEVEYLAIDDPAAYAAMAFRTVLAAHGITVAGAARAKHREVRDGMGFNAAVRAPGGQEDITVAGGEVGGSCLQGISEPTLATHVSAPLGDDVIYTDKVSQNLHAELLLHHLGRRVFCGQGSTVAGARMVRAFALHAGLAADDFLFYDGSGLSTQDLVAPRALAQLLAYDAKQPWFAELKAALPVGGVDGSLGARYSAKTSALNGRVFAKTGTLGESRALAGYVTAASGKTVVFSVMVDTHLPTSAADRVVMDKIVELIGALN